MHIVLISGTTRKGGQSLRVAQYLNERLPVLDGSITTDLIDLTGNPLPFWDETFWKAGSELQKVWDPFARRLHFAAGLVVISPEWHGMVPAGLKNFFLFCSPKEIGHKPALIVTCSASRGGAYPVNELRTSSYKNSMVCYIPQHLIVREVNNVLGRGNPANKEDEYIRDRADYSLRVLLAYARRLIRSVTTLSYSTRDLKAACSLFRHAGPGPR
jgi:NAD(P)H-dependent FMN reductase